MKIINFKNKLPLTYFAPNYNYFIIENNISDKININEILSNMLNIEKELIKGDKSINTINDTKQATSINRYKFFNKTIFTKKYMVQLINILRENIFNYSKILCEPIPKRLWVQMWCNILREKQKIEIHQHSDSETSYLSGNLCLQANNTKTHYVNPQSYFATFNPDYSSQNIKGNLTLFPSTLPHYTDRVEDKELRVTLAFDVLIAEDRKKLLWEEKKQELFKDNIFEL
jgi:hypothetical protein